MLPETPIGADPHADFGVRLVRELPRLRRHLAARVEPGARLDDAVQETVLQALQGAARFDLSRDVWPWLRTIADRTRRGTADRREEPLQTEPLAVERPTERAQQDLETLLARLPEPERAVIERHYVRGESVREIASGLGIARGTVQSRMWRARRRLALIAAALATAVWLVVRGVPPDVGPAPPMTLSAPLTLETVQLAAPSLSTVDHAADGPFTWSLEGATWSDDDPPDDD